MSNFNFISYKKQLDAALEKQTNNALEICGGKAESYAKENCPVDTGHLRNSISHKVDKQNKVAYIGSNVEYAPFVEFGTGQFYNGGVGGRQSGWTYTKKGEAKNTIGMRGREFLKRAIVEHRDEYRKILKDALKTK